MGFSVDDIRTVLANTQGGTLDNALEALLRLDPPPAPPPAPPRLERQQSANLRELVAMGFEASAARAALAAAAGCVPRAVEALIHAG